MKRSFKKQRQNLILIAAIVITAGAVFLLQYGSNRIRKSRSAAEKGEEATFNIDQEGFKEFLSRATPDQLVNLSLDLTDNSSEDLNVRLDKMQKRQAIADRILHQDPDDEARQFAASTRLTMIMDREYLFHKNSIVDSGTAFELKELATRGSQSSDPLIVNLSSTADAVAVLSEYLSETSARARENRAQETIEKFQRAVSIDVNNAKTAKRLFDWIKLLDQQCEARESHPFFEAFVNGYSGSSNPEVVKLVATSSGADAGSQIDFADVRNAAASDRDEAVGSLMEQINQTKELKQIADADVQAIIGKCTDLLALGRIEEAKAARITVTEFPNIGRSADLQSQLKTLDENISLFQQPFSLLGLIDIQGRQAEFRPGNVKSRVLLFVSAANYGQAVLKGRQLIKLAVPEIRKSNLELAIIYLDTGQHPKHLADFKVLEEKSEDLFSVWLLRPEQARQSNLTDQLNITGFPYLVVLGADKHVIQLNPPDQVMEEQIFGD